LGAARKATGPWPDAKAGEEIVQLLGRRALPDIDWLKRVTGRETVEVCAVLRETADLLRTERLIHRALERTGRTYYAQFPAPLELYVITRMLHPRHAVESGVSSGLSSAHILMALEGNRRGRLHSIDLPQYQKAQQRTKGELSWSVPLGKDSGWAIPARLKVNWDLRKGRSEDVLPQLVNQLPSIDLFCHDSPWTPAHLAFEFETVRPKLRSGSIVVADNTGVNPEAVRTLGRVFGTKAWHRGASSLIGMRIP
jgi:Methyltransferase domain